MSRFHSYLNTAKKIIESYDGSQPFAYSLKKFLSAEKKYGSRDRRLISSLCYSYFRVGHALQNLSAEEKIIFGYFLCENPNRDLLAQLKPEWNKHLFLSGIERFDFLAVDPLKVFPFAGELSTEIDPAEFALSFIQQPSLFLRIRPGFKSIVHNKLKDASIAFESLNEETLRLLNTTRIDEVLALNKEAVVQDYNSQQILNAVNKNFKYPLSDNRPRAWDCCAASGGKSILLYDKLEGKIELTVSDVRQNILANLETRFQQAGIKKYKKFIADLTKNIPLASDELFDIILCDAPCTGSGTWARNPEQLFYFGKEMIDMYVERQQKIVSGIIKFLKPGGLLVYITCSVFKKENEDIVEYAKDNFQLELLQMEYLKGYEVKADTMFVAVLKNSLTVLKFL